MRRQSNHQIRSVKIVGDVAFVPLACGGISTVDAEDADFVSRFNWSREPSGRTSYAVTNLKCAGGKFRHVKMHRLLLRPKPGYEVDHRDRDGLNNRRSNLIICTRAENCRNRSGWSRSGVKGVYLYRTKNKWMSKIKVDKVSIYLGVFDRKEDAHAAYLKARLQYFGVEA